jgi:hypothetical protein
MGKFSIEISRHGNAYLYSYPLNGNLVRVIFAGTTGIRKHYAINKIVGKALTEAKQPTDPDNIHAREFIRYFDFESELEKKFKIPLWTFRTSLHFKEQHDMWKQTFNQILDDIDNNPSKHVFISLHTTFFNSSRFFSTLDHDAITRFKPELFINFIEDTYAVWQRIVTKTVTKEDPAKSYLRLRDIMVWRTVEILVTDMLAKTLSVKNYVVAIKHPLNMLFNLIFNPKILFVYASFPISKTRNEADRRKEIDGFRFKLHGNYVIFDPLTIDEKILQFIPKKGKRTILHKDRKWPIPAEFPLVGDDDLKFPISLNTQEVEEISQDIDDNVKFRDFRLISDVDALVAYRPYWGKVVHEGVKSEIDFATTTMKPSHLYFPKEDGETDKSPFKAGGVPYGQLEELYSALEKQTPSENRRWGGLI